MGTTGKLPECERKTAWITAQTARHVAARQVTMNRDIKEQNVTGGNRDCHTCPPVALSTWRTSEIIAVRRGIRHDVRYPAGRFKPFAGILQSITKESV